MVTLEIPLDGIYALKPSSQPTLIDVPRLLSINTRSSFVLVEDRVNEVTQATTDFETDAHRLVRVGFEDRMTGLQPSPDSGKWIN